MRDPVTVTACAALTVPVVAGKVAVLWPTATDTLAGTVKVALLLLRPTELAVVAAWFSETVHVLVALLPRVEGAHDNEEICVGVEPVSVKVVEVPFIDPVSRAV